MSNRIILPLDHLDADALCKVVEKTEGLVWGYKLRRSVLDQGLSIVSEVKKYGKVMLDFKLYDIPSAMAESLMRHFNAGADITTVHCTAGFNPAENGMKSKGIAGVTVLTSMGPEVFGRYYQKMNIAEMVFRMGQDACGRYEYLVSSASDLEVIRALAIRKICPGIRPAWYHAKDDQNRVMTPGDAIRAGADLLVIGRPLLSHPDIVEAVGMTNQEIESALE